MVNDVNIFSLSRTPHSLDKKKYKKIEKSLFMDKMEEIWDNPIAFPI